MIRSTTLALLLAGSALVVPQAALAQDGNATEAPASEAATAPAAPDPAASDPATVVATVNGNDITEGDIAIAVEQQGDDPADPRMRAAALAQLIDITALAARGEAAGLADESFERRLELLRLRELATDYIRGQLAERITDELLQERYQAEVANVPPTEEVRASHILVETEEEAKAIIEELDGGADFAELAREKSTGPSGPNGGDLGFFGPGRMVPAFDQAARALEVGAVTSEPVQTQFGFHVIKVTDKREAGPPPFEQVRSQVADLVRREVETETLTGARGEVEIEIRDETLAGMLNPVLGLGGADGDEAGDAAAEGAETETEAQ